MRLIVTLFLLFTSLTSYCQKVSVEHIAPGANPKPVRQGFIYSLPRNLVVVEIGLKKTKSIPGKLFNFCDAYPERCIELGITEIQTKKDSVYEITDYKITTRAVVDTMQIYRVELKKRWNKAFVYNFSISDQGLIQGADVTATDKTFEVITSGLGAAVSILAKVFALRPTITTVPDSLKRIETKLNDLITSRNSLMKSLDAGAGVQFQIQEIDKQIDEIKLKIKGTEKTKTTVYRFEIDLNVKPTSETIAQFSSKKGIYSTLFNTYLFYDPDFRNTKAEGKVISVALTKVPGLGTAVAHNTSPDQSGKKGLAYRIPCLVSATLKNGEKIVAVQSLSLAQLGSIAHMPYKLTKANIAYYEELGLIKTLNAEAASGLTDNVTTAKDLINSGIDLTKKKDELTKLQEENALLEEKKKNIELKEFLDKH